MQPYFLPYLGYFQLIRAVDAFVIYDNIQFAKKGWIHRNRILINGSAALFTIPIKRASDYLDVNQRELASNCSIEIAKHLRRIQSAYSKAPYFHEAMPIIEECFAGEDTNLFSFVYHAIRTLLSHLKINTPIHISSSLSVSRSLKGEERVIATCKTLGATHYINSPGGKELYKSGHFATEGVELSFLEPKIPEYSQFEHPFVANLSVIDVIMFNGQKATNKILDSYSLQQA
jgi:hypothetical protein